MSIKLVSSLALCLALSEAANAAGPTVIANQITHFITFNSRDYALAGDTEIFKKRNISLPAPCDKVKYEFDGDWAIAEDSNDTRAFIMSKRYPFWYDCKVTSSGKGWLNDLTEDALCNDDMLTTEANDKKSIYSVTPGYCGAIVISRPSTLKDTWTSEKAISNTLTLANGMVYATLDNTPSNKLTCDGDKLCCQDYAMKIPAGWELASPTQDGYKEAASKPWGAYCVGLSKVGKPCGYKVITTGDYASMLFCTDKVLISRKAVDCVETWSAWSACSNSKPSEKTRSATVTTEAQFGGAACQKSEKTQVGCDQNIPVSPVTTAAASTTAAAAATTATTTAGAATGAAGAASTTIASSTKPGASVANMPSMMAVFAAALGVAFLN